MKNLQKLMKQAQKMQEKLETEMGQLQVEASSGGGMVNVNMDGKKQLLSITIEPESVDPDEVEMLQDLILAAVNEAGRRVDEALKDHLGGFTQGLLG
ncbi:YbaB/EbfC family nucleoid-associated protein [Acidobacteria bacterium AH-259-D05]|nr:YbaB/EbfC family nucleoid-associated protein [Acidobacteria bacterium AH-259-D05]